MKTLNNEVLLIQNSIRTVLSFRLPLIKFLISKGYNVRILAPNDCQSSTDDLEKIGCAVITLKPYGNFLQFTKFIFQFNFHAYREIRRCTYTYCFFLSTFFMLYVPVNIFSRRVTVSVEGLGSLFLLDSFKSSLLKTIFKLSNVQKFFCNNDEKATLGSKNDFVTNGIGINLNEFYLPVEKDFSNIEILYVGRLVQDKGINDVIKAFELIDSRGLNIKLNIVGDLYPNNPSSLSENDLSIYKKKFGGKINFVGYTKDVKYWYHKSHILLLPSKREGFPVCVMEASACGLPSIVYDVPGCVDAVSKGENGLICKSGNIESLSENLLLLADQSVLKGMFEKCNAYAIENFDSTKKIQDFISHSRLVAATE